MRVRTSARIYVLARSGCLTKCAAHPRMETSNICVPLHRTPKRKTKCSPENPTEPNKVTWRYQLSIPSQPHAIVGGSGPASTPCIYHSISLSQARCAPRLPRRGRRLPIPQLPAEASRHLHKYQQIAISLHLVFEQVWRTSSTGWISPLNAAGARPCPAGGP